MSAAFPGIDPDLKQANLESLESSSPIVTRAVAAGLCGEFHHAYALAPWQRRALKGLGLFPQGLAGFILSRFAALSSLDAKLLKGLSIETLATARLSDYAGLRGPFPAVTVGAALGGASAHLALALGGPFLPQAFVLTLRGGSPDGDIHVYFRRSNKLALEIAQRNPGILTIQHYDPIHDGWLTRYVNHLRLKLLNLPQVYAGFLREYLQPGGAICYLDCGAEWLRYRIGARSVFQIGGWGDISPQEFLNGSERIRQYCRSAGLKKTAWQMPEFDLEQGPESEWGSEPGLGEALQAFCHQEGYRFVPVRLPTPQDYSTLAYLAVARLLELEKRSPAGVLVEMFSQFDATAIQQSGLLPLWLVFNTRDSLSFLEEMRPQFPQGKPVFFSALSTFSRTPDLVPWEDWENALMGLDWVNIGARPTHYPADALALADWNTPLHGWVSRNRQPIHTRLDAEDLSALAEAITGRAHNC